MGSLDGAASGPGNHSSAAPRELPRAHPSRASQSRSVDAVSALAQFRDALVTRCAEAMRISGLPSPGWRVGGGPPLAAALRHGGAVRSPGPAPHESAGWAAGRLSSDSQSTLATRLRQLEASAAASWSRSRTPLEIGEAEWQGEATRPRAASGQPLGGPRLTCGCSIAEAQSRRPRGRGNASRPVRGVSYSAIEQPRR